MPLERISTLIAEKQYVSTRHLWFIFMLGISVSWTSKITFSSSLISFFYCLILQLFETELKQSENKVQELKDKVTELLEKNPNSPEAPKWRQVLDKIGT